MNYSKKNYSKKNRQREITGGAGDELLGAQ